MYLIMLMNHDAYSSSIRFLIKTIIIMSISINIHRPYVCDLLGQYISLVNNSIDQITSYWSTLINYQHQHMDELINHKFKPIDKLSCQLIRCQTTRCTLGDMEYVRTLSWNLSIIGYHVCIILYPHETRD